MIIGTSTAVGDAASFRRKLRIGGVAVAAAGLLGGCAELTSIYHSRSLEPSPRIITTDAYQRSVFIVPDGVVPRGTPKKWRLCAEPAPDAFAALSASLAAKGDVKQQQVELGVAIAQSGATFERTQTVNLLRESMYRTCERYLSGALNKDQFIVQAARDQRAMTAVLAIEQLTRTARPPAIMLAPAGTAASVGGETGAELVQDFAAQKTTAKEARDTAEGAYKAALTTGKCEAVTTAPAGDEGTDPTLTAWTACNTAKATRTAREADYKAASDRLDKVIEVARNSRPITAGTTGGTPSTGEGGANLSDVALIAVAKAVESIAVAPAINEALMFCIAYLSSRGAEDSLTTTGCLGILKQRATSDANVSQSLLLRTGGQTFDLISDPIGGVGDTAGPALRTYFGEVTGAEQDRRFALAVRAVQSLGRGVDRQAVSAVVTGPSNEDRAQLRAILCTLETNMAGRTSLQCP